MNVDIILKISIILQFLAALLALALIPLTRRRLAWVLIAAALVLMSCRRVISLCQPEFLGLFPTSTLTAEWVALATSALMLAGIAWIAPMFRSIQRTNLALARSEAKYRELVEHANSIILRLDPRGRITFFNEFAQKFFGYSEKEILGREMVGAIMPALDRQGLDLAAMAADLVANPERYPVNEHENRRRNGEFAWITWTTKAIRDEQGRLTEIL